MIEHYQIWCLFFAHYCFFRVGSRHPLTCPNFLHTGMYTSWDVFIDDYFEFSQSITNSVISG